MAQRKTLRTRTLNDDVDECHVKLWADPSYKALFLSIWREETVEGSFIADDITAAMRVRDQATSLRLPIAKGAKLAAIVNSLHVVARRYQLDRKTRRNMVGGESVPGSDDE